MLKRGTGSKIGLLMRCPGSHGLPWVRTSGAAAQLGIAIHHACRMVSDLGVEDGLTAARLAYPDYTEACGQIPFGELSDVLKYEAEASMALSFGRDEARRLTLAGPRDYSQVANDEIAMTIDILGVEDDYVYVGDYKTGYTPLGAAKDNAQLLTAAVAAAHIYGKSRAIVELIYIHGDIITRDRAELDIFDLERFRNKLNRLHTKLAVVADAVSKGQAPDVNAGRWCRDCPAHTACPAQKSLAIELATGNDNVPFNASLTRSQMADAYEKVKLAQNLLNKVTAAIYAEAEREPIRLKNGKMLGQVHKEGNEKLDGEVAYRVIAELTDASTAGNAFKHTASKKAIADFVKEYALEVTKAIDPEADGSMSQKALKLELLNRIRDAGGVTKKPSVKVEEYHVQKM